MKNYKQFFKGKKITVMGLGILGRGLGYTKFLAECGADLIVTDLKTKEQLKDSVKAITNYQLRITNSKKIKYVLGEHRLEDFKDRDMVIKAAGVPLDSPYIAEARKNGIPIEMDVSLFAKCTPRVMIVGVTGTRGKSMTVAIIYEILKQNEKFLKQKVYIGGNVRGVATLPLLKKVRAGDILVCELDSWQLQGFGEEKMSPHISVFTSFMPDHMNYYKDSMERYFEDKANIFKYQNKNDVLIIRPGMKEFIKKSDVMGKLIVANRKNIVDYPFTVPGKFQQENLACAVEVAKQFSISNSNIKKAVTNFKGLEGRLQLLKMYKGIKIYNDNNATIPKATIGGIEAISVVSKPSARKVLAENPPSRKATAGRRKIILICGGSDKNLDLDSFVKVINKFCKAVILIPGTGTERLINNYELRITNEVGKDLKEVVKIALGLASRGDTILFSPAFASFGMFNNEYERNDLFIKIIRRLK